MLTILFLNIIYFSCTSVATTDQNLEVEVDKKESQFLKSWSPERYFYVNSEGYIYCLRWKGK